MECLIAGRNMYFLFTCRTGDCHDDEHGLPRQSEHAGLPPRPLSSYGLHGDVELMADGMFIGAPFRVVFVSGCGHQLCDSLESMFLCNVEYEGDTFSVSFMVSKAETP